MGWALRGSLDPYGLGPYGLGPYGPLDPYGLGRYGLALMGGARMDPPSFINENYAFNPGVQGPFNTFYDAKEKAPYIYIYTFVYILRGLF